jgi:hypothetical protein
MSIAMGTNQTTPPSSPFTQPIQGGAGGLQQEYIHRAAWKAGVLGAINALSIVLAVRLILLFAVCGAFALAYLGLSSPAGMGILVVYTVAVVIPLVALAAFR